MQRLEDLAWKKPSEARQGAYVLALCSAQAQVRRALVACSPVDLAGRIRRQRSVDALDQLRHEVVGLADGRRPASLLARGHHLLRTMHAAVALLMNESATSRRVCVSGPDAAPSKVFADPTEPPGALRRVPARLPPPPRSGWARRSLRQLTPG